MSREEPEGEHDLERFRPARSPSPDADEEELPPNPLFHHQQPLAKYCSRKWSEAPQEGCDAIDSAFLLTKIFRKRQEV